MQFTDTGARAAGQCSLMRFAWGLAQDFARVFDRVNWG